ncbi:hypothetical protein [Sphingomonas sp. Leaf25]|uniref:hypothetical protein n=1 Tax=Sphingomonas sp. Leaf25 TaxID=1735692 RepID=UPI0012E0D183|nr:hypothetical protein [Sphingomonas sp. Leaf25]
MLMSCEIWREARITPTALDLQQQASGNKPAGLSLNSGYLNDAANRVLAGRIGKVMVDRGWAAGSGQQSIR